MNIKLEDLLHSKLYQHRFWTGLADYMDRRKTNYPYIIHNVGAMAFYFSKVSRCVKHAVCLWTIAMPKQTYKVTVFVIYMLICRNQVIMPIKRIKWFHAHRVSVPFYAVALSVYIEKERAWIKTDFVMSTVLYINIVKQTQTRDRKY